MKMQKLIRYPLTLLGVSLVGASTLFVSGNAVAASQTLTSSQCNSRLDVSISGDTRSVTTATADCQDRTLAPDTGFTVATSTPAGGVVADSAAMTGAGGELYEAEVSSSRDAAVLLTPNRALMVSRKVSGNASGVDWDLGLAVQPVTGGSNAWLTGTYSMLSSEVAVRSVRASDGQVSAALSKVFDPSTFRVVFNGDGTCTASAHSSMYSYELTQDPGAQNDTSSTTSLGNDLQPDGANYGFHQVAFAGDGASPSQDPVSDLTFNSCTYSLATDGLLTVTYDYDDGNASNTVVTRAYFISADLRYIVSTDDAGGTLTRGYEAGVRIDTALAGTQDERNDAVANTYLFNAPSIIWRGSTGPLTSPDVETINKHKATECIARGQLVLSTTAHATSGWNECTLSQVSTCSVRGEQGYGETSQVGSGNGDGDITTLFSTHQRSATATDCRFQVDSDSDLSLVVTIDTPEGSGDVSFDGAIADNNEAFVLRGKYEGTDIANPDTVDAPARPIKNVLWLKTLVAMEYAGTLTSNEDGDSLTNYEEFVWGDFYHTLVRDDYDSDMDDDLVFQDSGNGSVTMWFMEDAARESSSWLGNSTSTLVAHADVDNDGDSDLLLQAANSTVTLWTMENGARESISTLGFQVGYTLTQTGDLDNDGDSDLIFEDGSGAVIVWTIEDGVRTNAEWIGTWAGQSVVSTADIDNDGDADIVTQDASGNVNVIEMEDATKVAARWVGVWAGRTVVGAGDADNDGDDDIFMENSGDVMVIEMENGNKVIGRWLGVWAGTEVLAVADIDADGDDDLVQQNSSTGSTQVVEMEGGNKVTGRWLGTFAYDMKGTIDADADGDVDVVLQDGSGNVALIEMENGSKLGGAKWLGVNTGDLNI